MSFFIDSNNLYIIFGAAKVPLPTFSCFCLSLVAALPTVGQQTDGYVCLIYYMYIIMLPSAGTLGYMHILEIGEAVCACNRMLTLGHSVSVPIDSCFGHLGLWPGLCVCKHYNKVLQCVHFKYSWYSRYSIYAYYIVNTRPPLSLFLTAPD